jgi:Family of unknown function (DUF5832)
MPAPKYRRKKAPLNPVKRAENDTESTKNKVVYEEPELPSWTKQEDVVDYLSEDDQLAGQKYVCLSMLSLSKWRTDQQRTDAIKTICKKDGFDLDISTKVIDAWSEFEESKRGLKIRGVYGSYGDAKKRSEFLQRTHKNHNIAISSVGMWVPFDPDPEKIADQNYMENELNQLKEGYMQNREKGKEHFEEQKAQKAQRARIEGSKWGQEQLLNRKETKQEIEYRVKLAEEDINQYNEKIEQAKSVLKQAQDKLEYIKDHPELILEEEESPIDIENVPAEVLKEIKDGKEKVDEKRMELSSIEAGRKHYDLGAAQKNQLQPPQPSVASATASSVSNKPLENLVAPIPENKGPLEEDLILPHQAREQIKKDYPTKII